MGAAAVMYDGKPLGTPDSGEYWRLIAKYRAKGVYIAPTAVRAIKKDDFEGNFLAKHDLSCLETIYLAGERCDPLTIKWLQEKVPHARVLDQWWQTETGSPVSGNSLSHPLPIVAGSASRPCFGWDV